MAGEFIFTWLVGILLDRSEEDTPGMTAVACACSGNQHLMLEEIFSLVSLNPITHNTKKDRDASLSLSSLFMHENSFRQSLR